MTEQISWGEHTYVAGDTFRLANDRRLVTLLDIVKTTEVYVVINYDQGSPVLLKGSHFAYHVDSGFYKRTDAPAYNVRDRFIHNLNEDILEVIAISPRESDATQNYTYFCVITQESGTSQYVAVDGGYISGLSMLDPAEDTGPPIPSVPVDAVFPNILYTENLPN